MKIWYIVVGLVLGFSIFCLGLSVGYKERGASDKPTEPIKHTLIHFIIEPNSAPICGTTDGGYDYWNDNFDNTTCEKCILVYAPIATTLKTEPIPYNIKPFVYTHPNTQKIIYTIEGRQIHIKMIGVQEQIDLNLLIEIESEGDPCAISPKGARGLCQIMEETWNECTELLKLDWDYWECWHNPKKNIVIGMFYVNNRIPKMMKYYNLWDNKQTRLACYNWGIGKVNRLVGETHTLNIKDLPAKPYKYIHDYRKLEVLGTRQWIKEKGGDTIIVRKLDPNKWKY